MCGEQKWGEDKAFFVKYYRARRDHVDIVHMAVGRLNG